MDGGGTVEGRGVLLVSCLEAADSGALPTEEAGTDGGGAMRSDGCGGRRLAGRLFDIAAGSCAEPSDVLRSLTKGATPVDSISVLSRSSMEAVVIAVSVLGVPLATLGAKGAGRSNAAGGVFCASRLAMLSAPANACRSIT